MKFFDTQNDEMHLTLKQMKSRINSVKNIKASEITMTSDTTCDILGSGAEPYHVTLDSCTCPDFIKNKRKKAPCLHIYRLASILGVYDFPEISESGKQAVDAQIPSEIQRWKKEFLSGNITPERYVNILDALAK